MEVLGEPLEGRCAVTAWLKQGFAIASVDYRLSPEARFPAQIHDIKGAIRYLRARANQWSLDPDRLIIAGASAGGHLAALVGVSSGVEALEGDVGDHPNISSRVQAIVSFTELRICNRSCPNRRRMA